ncbi:MAG: TauD/TfdA family dioxygenase, partial [Acidobacteria bacterium]|nr:TauD/TfdA family dioxygenase [Acidobacteriota bacterium]
MASQIFQERIQDDRAWTADSIGQDRPWCLHLDQRCWDLIDPLVQVWRQDPQPITQVRLSETQRQEGAEVLADVLRMLETGYGFVLLDRIPLDRYSHQEATLAYWLIGQFMGQPFEQNVNGTLLYDVRDVGGDLSKGSRFSVTHERTSFHTDGAFNQVIADHVGLLCLFTAKTGGESQMMSAYSLHNRLIERNPDLLEVLY